MQKDQACLFCGCALKGKRTTEHVFPDWLLKARRLSQHEIERVVIGRDGKEKTRRKAHVLDKIRLGPVCGDCNSGWMSDLEDKAKKVLTPLFDVKSIPKLKPAKREVLALWTVKTAAMLNWSSNYGRLVTADEIRVLNGGSTIPDQISVYLAHNPYKTKVEWLETEAWETIVPTHLTMVGANGWKIALQFGNLCLIAAKTPDPRLIVIHAEDVHVPIYSPSVVPLKKRLVGKLEEKDSGQRFRRIVGLLTAVAADYDGSDPIRESYI